MTERFCQMVDEVPGIGFPAGTRATDGQDTIVVTHQLLQVDAQGLTIDESTLAHQTGIVEPRTESDRGRNGSSGEDLRQDGLKSGIAAVIFQSFEKWEG